MRFCRRLSASVPPSLPAHQGQGRQESRGSPRPTVAMPSAGSEYVRRRNQTLLPYFDTQKLNAQPLGRLSASCWTTSAVLGPECGMRSHAKLPIVRTYFFSEPPERKTWIFSNRLPQVFLCVQI